MTMKTPTRTKPNKDLDAGEDEGTVLAGDDENEEEPGSVGERR